MTVIKVTTDDLLSVQNAAKELGRPRLAIYRMIERGDIISIKLGGILFIPVSEVERVKNLSMANNQQAKRESDK
jgi:excisionase family DNA binding protein